MGVLPRSFYARDTVLVARALLGQRLVRVLDGRRLSGLISETEAYRGSDDQASHAYRLTPRSAIMFGPPGYAYVYIIYGRNFCLNVVTETDGVPGAVLIRGLRPEVGLEVMRARRGVPASGASVSARPGKAARRGSSADRNVADGPGKLCQAIGIDDRLNGWDLTDAAELSIEAGCHVEDGDVAVTPRIGVRGDEETRRRPWRFLWTPSVASV